MLIKSLNFCHCQTLLRNIHNLYPYLLIFDKVVLINFMNLYDSAFFGWYDQGDVFVESMGFLKNRLKCYDESDNGTCVLNKELEKQIQADLPTILGQHIDAGVIDNYIISKELPNAVPLIRREADKLQEKLIKLVKDGDLDIEHDNDEELSLYTSNNSKAYFMDMLVDLVSNSSGCILTDIDYTSSLYGMSESRSFKNKNSDIEKINIIALGILGRSLNSIPQFQHMSLDQFIRFRESLKSERQDIFGSVFSLSCDLLKNIHEFTILGISKEIDHLMMTKILPDLNEFSKSIRSHLKNDSYTNCLSNIDIKDSSASLGGKIPGDGVSAICDTYEYSVFLKTLYEAKTSVY